ncbi:MAG: hypothetical protein DRJ42_11395 [Deltaproteobacteria bacterium]|nr:MAG: hypothetical protein DRJ42_11395 [Deltaproteobacteria bacterium]
METTTATATALFVMALLTPLAHAQSVVRVETAVASVEAVEASRENRGITRSFAFTVGAAHLIIFVDEFTGEIPEVTPCPEGDMPGVGECEEPEPVQVPGLGGRVLGVARVVDGDVDVLVEFRFRQVRYDWDLVDVDGDSEAELTIRLVSRGSSMGPDGEELWVLGPHEGTTILQAKLPLRGPRLRDQCGFDGYAGNGDPRFVRTEAGRAIEIDYELTVTTDLCRETTEGLLCDCEMRRAVGTFHLGIDGRFRAENFGDRGPFGRPVSALLH